MGKPRFLTNGSSAPGHRVAAPHCSGSTRVGGESGGGAVGAAGLLLGAIGPATVGLGQRGAGLGEATPTDGLGVLVELPHRGGVEEAELLSCHAPIVPAGCDNTR